MTTGERDLLHSVNQAEQRIRRDDKEANNRFQKARPDYISISQHSDTQVFLQLNDHLDWINCGPTERYDSGEASSVRGFVALPS